MKIKNIKQLNVKLYTDILYSLYNARKGSR